MSKVTQPYSGRAGLEPTLSAGAVVTATRRKAKPQTGRLRGGGFLGEVAFKLGLLGQVGKGEKGVVRVEF